MKKISIKTEYIKLGEALKLSGLVQSGGEAKEIILDGRVFVDGEVCTQRGKKIYDGSVVLVISQDGEKEEFVTQREVL